MTMMMEPESAEQAAEAAEQEKKGPGTANDAADGAGEIVAADDLAGHDGAVADEGSDAESTENSDGNAAADIRLIEALLLSTHHPLTPARLVDLTGAANARAIRAAVKQLNSEYEAGRRAFRIEQVAGGYQMLTLPEFGAAIAKLQRKEADAKLTKSALETLAIIAYKQPVLRVDVEAIRGVACGETIRALMEKHLVKIAARAEVPGRPILYGTTKRFLEVFGLNGIKDLPSAEELLKPRGNG